MFDRFKKSLGIRQKRKGEVNADEYFSALLPSTDAENVQYLRDSIHSTLLDLGVHSALIAVGSVVTGVSSKKDYWRSGGPDDIDLKVIVADQKQGEVFYEALQKWSKGLNERMAEITNAGSLVGRYTHRPFPEEHVDFCYDVGFVIKPVEGKTIDLIVKCPAYLPSGPHIEAERKRDHAFVLLYQDV